MALVSKLQAYAPHFAGKSELESAVKAVISVIEKSSVPAGDGGSYISHFGNKQWL